MEILKKITESNQWTCIESEILLGVMSLLLLGLGTFLPKQLKIIIPRVVMGGFLTALLYILIFSNTFSEQLFSSFDGMLIHTSLGKIMRVFFLFSSIIVGHLASIYFSKQNLPRTEFYHLLTFATIGLMLLAQSNHFIMLFVLVYE